MKKAIDIDVNTIAREVGMSKSSFYRKDKAYHGSFARRVCEKYPAEACIRTFRKGGDVIGSVAYSTGFSSAKYFSTCFKEQFGITPTEFLRRRELDV